jgi:hypothetical protein
LDDALDTWLTSPIPTSGRPTPNAPGRHHPRPGQGPTPPARSGPDSAGLAIPGRPSTLLPAGGLPTTQHSLFTASTQRPPSLYLTPGPVVANRSRAPSLPPRATGHPPLRLPPGLGRPQSDLWILAPASPIIYFPFRTEWRPAKFYLACVSPFPVRNLANSVTSQIYLACVS